MSKVITIENNIDGTYRRYRSIKGLQKIHEDYGLWIVFGHAFSKSYSAVHTEPIPRSFDFYTISHLQSGHGWFWTPENGRQTFEPGEAVMIRPNMIQDYNGFDTYDEDFICFNGPLADHLARAGIIKMGIIRIGKVRRLLPIIKMAADPRKDSQLKANIALQTLLMDLYFENKKRQNNSQAAEIEKLISIIIKNPEKWWSVSDMAEMVKLSLNQFIRVFTAHTGMTPKKYIDNFKIKLAAEALHNSSDTLSQIAEQLGYQDPFHFSKRFKEITGVSPAEYRKRTSFS